MKTKSIALIIIGVFALYSFNTGAFSGKDKKQGILFFQGTFAQALNMAKKEKKIIFLDAYASWCGPCKRMSRNTFVNEKVAKFYNKKFINLAIDMEKGEGPALGNKYPIQAYPTLMFISPEGKIINKVIGFYKAEDFLELGEQTAKMKLKD